MASRSKRRVQASDLNGKIHGTGDGRECAAQALRELKAIGGLLVRSSVSLMNGDAADQFVWLGKQIQTHAEQGMTALAPPAARPPSKPRRTGAGRR